jgi:hypothetical protein
MSSIFMEPVYSIFAPGGIRRRSGSAPGGHRALA